MWRQALCIRYIVFSLEQMIYAKTEVIGCAANTCKHIDGANTRGSLMVCYYGPGCVCVYITGCPNLPNKCNTKLDRNVVHLSDPSDRRFETNYSGCHRTEIEGQGRSEWTRDDSFRTNKLILSRCFEPKPFRLSVHIYVFLPKNQ